MPESIAPFPSAIHDKIFFTDDGDACVFLHEAWPSLLADLSRLGPAFVISRNEKMSLVSLRPGVEFLRLPESTEMVDGGSGLCLDTASLGTAIAGKERRSGQLSLHFFDTKREPLFKLVLARGADEDAFAQLLVHYARDPAEHHSFPGTAREISCEGAVLAEEKRHFQEAWAHFDPCLGGDFLPGGHGVSWWNALRLAGGRRAMFLTKVGLIKTILGAHQERSGLRLTTWHGRLEHHAAVVPLRLERCDECLHLLGTTSEAHFFLGAEMQLWVGFHGEDCLPTIHIFSERGRRCGLIQLEKAGCLSKTIC